MARDITEDVMVTVLTALRIMGIAMEDGTTDTIMCMGVSLVETVAAAAWIKE